MDKKTLKDAEKAALVQANQYSKSVENIDKLDNLFNKIADKDKEQLANLKDLDEKANQLLKARGIDPNIIAKEDIDISKFERRQRMKEARAKLKAQKQISEEYGINLIETIDEVDDWDTYIQRVEEYADKYNVDLESDPYRQLLTPEQYKNIIDEYHLKFGKVEWCAADYAVVGLSVLTAVLTDYFLVAVPPVNTKNGIIDSAYLTKFKKDNPTMQSSPITKFLLEQKNKVMNAKKGDNKVLRMLKIYQGKLEQFAKVPFDPATSEHEPLLKGLGITPKDHRIKSLGHDPLFGIIFGVRDIMTGKMTLIDNDSNRLSLYRSNFNNIETNPIKALIKWICHIISDIPTTKGVPIPGLTLLRAINMQTPFKLGPKGEEVSLNYLITWMYKNGYTLDHFITMSIVPMIIELFIGTYYTVSNFELLHKMEDYKRKEDVKLQSMLALAHTLTMGGNIAKMAFMAWNPTAFNLAECLQMVRTWMKLYQAEKTRDLKINKTLYLGWEELNYNY